MNRLYWIIPLSCILLVSCSSDSSTSITPTMKPTEVAIQPVVTETQVIATPTQPEPTAPPASLKPEMDGDWNLHISWDCVPPVYDLTGEMTEGSIQISDKRGGKIPKGVYMIRTDTPDVGNLWINTFNSSDEKTEDYILGKEMTPIFITNYSFVGTVNDARSQVKNGKFDITNNKGENVSGCWEAEKK